MKTLHAYLTFDGQCEEAFTFYQSVFGGEITHMGRFKDMPAEFGVSASQSERVMHVTLNLGNGLILFGSDSLENTPPIVGTNFSLSINPDSQKEADQLMAKLSDGGQITMPLQTTFWGSYFGTCKDKYGIQWMINYNLNEN